MSVSTRPMLGGSYLLSALLALGCDSGPPEPQAKAEAKSTATAKPAPKAKGAPSPGKPGIKASIKKQGDIEWGRSIQWRSYEKGLEEAAKSGKSICVVVYADWCPKCRKLAPAFSKPNVVKASKDLVMVLQDADAEPEWLNTAFGKYGRYVPRVFFLDSAGNVREELKSSHPRYPYFYAASQVPLLEKRMKEAAAGSAVR